VDDDGPPPLLGEDDLMDEYEDQLATKMKTIKVDDPWELGRAGSFGSASDVENAMMHAAFKASLGVDEMEEDYVPTGLCGLLRTTTMICGVKKYYRLAPTSGAVWRTPSDWHWVTKKAKCEHTILKHFATPCMKTTPPGANCSAKPEAFKKASLK
jgi:hypothetical protein